jgi:MoCo/4Fe-4S cofactor protein with predicted Tat translocation signal
MNDEAHRGREKLPGKPAQQDGPSFWRSLEELSPSDSTREALFDEFPPGASDWPELMDPVGRRRFLQLSTASLGLAGLAGCSRQPLETIVPYVDAPEDIIPGKPLYFATSTELRGVAAGVLVESHMGRPTKVEGNAEHPAGTGATDLFSQASVLELYDPDRSQIVSNAGRISTWRDFLDDLRRVLDPQRTRKGAGLRILTGAVSSPTLAGQIGRLLAEFPEARWHVYEPVPRDEVWAGTELAFGARLEPRYRFGRADVVLALDADFLTSSPGALVYTRDFAARRRADHPDGLSRVYAVEPSPTLVGAKADHRLRLRPREMGSFVQALAREIGLSVPEAALSPDVENWVKAAASDLLAHRGRSLVVAGEQQPARVHALAHLVNLALGNAGATVVYGDPVEVFPESYTGALRSIAELVSDTAKGSVELLVTFGGNPVYDSPADLAFAEHYAKIPFRVHLGLYADETAALAHWHIPRAQTLESWGDGRAFDGTVTLRQPLIDPLYGGKTPSTLLAALLGTAETTDLEILRNHWRENSGVADFESFWRRSLHDGFLAGTAFEPRSVAASASTSDLFVEDESDTESLDVVFRPDPTVFDGRFANNAWLQETPKPFTKLTWDNAALLSPATAERLGLQNEDVVEIGEDEKVEAPVWILPGQADGVVCLHLGYGRRQAGQVAAGAGFDAQRLRRSDAFWTRSDIAVRRTDKRYPLSTTQTHQSMEGRELVREATLEVYERDPHFAQAGHHDPGTDLSLYPPRTSESEYSWGMSIDLAACTGCSACVVACQAENNIPVVGKEEVSRGREMHWIRIDRYFEGTPEDPRIHHQPVACMHCENAPCEVVCPVGATVHNEEGLNTMIYNRCVGTRYCSNNCPYKVRRFNFLQYADEHTPVLALLNNPNVTVRSRGVMEKCSYCIQRINLARISAEKQDRTLRDGEVVTACQQVCPAQAIVFGNLRDPASRVSGEKASSRNYGILTEVGTRPHTTYMAKVRNPNPTLKEPS